MRSMMKAAAILVLGIMFGGIALAGLETVTHIQDLNTSWPLGSDLASTSDDHIRNIKSALKTDLPNFNGTYTSAALPVFAIPSDTNTGMYSVGADDLGFSTGGTLRFDISTTAFTGTLPFRGQDGTNAAPAFSFSGDTDTGIYRTSANTIGFATGGVLQFDITGSTYTFRPAGTAAAQITATQSFWQDGAVGTPSISFFNDTDTGWYRQGSGAIGYASNGVLTLGIFNTGVYLLNGTSSLPAYSFDSDTDTGFYRDTANQIGVALGGSTAGQIAQGTFTGTLTGMSSATTGTVSYQRFGNVCTLWVTATISGTSNTNAMTMTGVPSVCQAASNLSYTQVHFTTNNGGTVQTIAQVQTGTVVFSPFTSVTAFGTGNYTSSGTKGLSAGWTISYVVF